MPEEFKDLQKDSFDNFSNWKKKEIENLRQVILNQIEKCRIELSKDLRKGGEYMVQTPKGVLPIYFPDQREVNVNSVVTLYDLMLYIFDDDAWKDIEEITDKIAGASDLYFKKYLEMEYCIPYKNIAIKTKEPVKGQHSKVGGVIEARLENYISEKHRELFRELILLFKRKRELSGKRTAGI